MERSTTVVALSQLKSSRQPKMLYELCPGYVDRNGIWNNGFNCPKWGHPDRNYCCGDAEERICCPEPDAGGGGGGGAGATVSLTDSNGSASEVGHHVIAGVVVGVLVITSLLLLICCCFCRCCPGYKRRTRPKPSMCQGDSFKESTSLRPKTKTQTSMTTTTTIGAVSLTPASSDWTSVPTDWTASDDEGGSRGGAFGLHCGCRWSPNHQQSCSAGGGGCGSGGGGCGGGGGGGDFRMQSVDVFDDFYDPCQSSVAATLTAAHHHQVLPSPHQHHLHHHHHQHLQHHHNRPMMHCVDCQLPTVDAHAAPPTGFIRRCPVV